MILTPATTCQVIKSQVMGYILQIQQAASCMRAWKDHALHKRICREVS